MTEQATRKIFTREFILGIGAQFTFISVYNILIPTLPIYLLKSGCGEVEIGVLIGVFFVSSLALRPIVGKALLRVPEKSFMTAGALIFVLTSAAYLIAPPFWPLFVLRTLQGVGLALFHTSSFTMVANISPKEHLGQSLSYFMLAPNISLAIVPSLGMFLINQFGFTPLFLACLGMSLCAFLITGRLPKKPLAPPEDSSGNSQGPQENLLNWKSLRPSGVSFFNFVIWGALTAFFPLYALNHGVANSGLFFTTVAVMFFVGRVLGGKILDLYDRDRVIPCLLVASFASMVILAFSGSLPMFVLVAVIWGIGNALLNPAILAYVLDRSDSTAGPAIGMFMLLSDLGLGLGPVIMGIVVRFTSYPIMFLSLALTGVVNLFYFYFLVRQRTAPQRNLSC
jgi:MFS family permease